ncbi:MAG: phosphonate C-P lyase system protein PhnH [Pseudomonadota bacterium]|nr:phosphonate C-P lyase system protein PhnH [Pseudomonadota bacterium]
MSTTVQSPAVVALEGLCDGFSDVTYQSQEVFRQVLAAMAEPGTRHDLAQLAAPGPLSPAAYQVCLALLDQETPVWLAPDVTSAAVINSLRFHCGCGIAARSDQALFALVTAQGGCSLSAFNQGGFEYPDRSATVIVEVDALEEAGELVLEGPGIPQQRHVHIAGIDAGWLQQLAENRAGFPCGVDLILTCGSQVMALPRTTRVSFEGQEK